jgi:hypothetical protein
MPSGGPGNMQIMHLMRFSGNTGAKTGTGLYKWFKFILLNFM